MYTNADGTMYSGRRSFRYARRSLGLARLSSPTCSNVTTYATNRLSPGTSSRAITVTSRTSERLYRAASISPSSMRNPRIFTWVSIRPKNSSVPSSNHRTRSPVLYIRSRPHPVSSRTAPDTSASSRPTHRLSDDSAPPTVPTSDMSTPPPPPPPPPTNTDAYGFRTNRSRVRSARPKYPRASCTPDRYSSPYTPTGTGCKHESSTYTCVFGTGRPIGGASLQPAATSIIVLFTVFSVGP
mmetsp:Transcript_19849/g.63046  ORF Transcript_19849/g.63046 Transcript_19849/m.63046 type:complete len:240 (-) Transcript_19849:938-1657(-)